MIRSQRRPVKDPPDGIYVVAPHVWHNTENGQQLTPMFPFTKQENSTRWKVLPERDGQLVPDWYPCAGNFAVAKWEVLSEWDWKVPGADNIAIPVVEVFDKRYGTGKYEPEDDTGLRRHRCSTENSRYHQSARL